MESQVYLQSYYAQRAEQRGNHARRSAGDANVRYAEAFQRVLPQVVAVAVSALSELARLGSATVYEAAGRRGLVDVALAPGHPAARGSQGPARTVRCGQGDNLMVHAAMASLEPGEVLVLTMPEPESVALVGDLLATQAKVHGAAAVLVDGAVRDVEELVELGPADLGAPRLDPRRDQGCSRRARRAGDRGRPGRSAPGDVVVLDADGVAVVARDLVDEVLAPRSTASSARRASARSCRTARSPTTSTASASSVEGRA